MSSILMRTKDSDPFVEDMAEFNIHSSMGIIGPLLTTLGSESERQPFTDIINTPITEEIIRWGSI